MIVTAPIGLGLGRLGNFINGELFGRVTTRPWGIVFPQGGPLPRHPSQLYEAFLEGLVLFIWLWWSKGRNRTSGGMVARFLIGYGLFRIIVEFFRDPDPQIGLLLNFLTMGQLLSFGMVLLGVSSFSPVPPQPLPLKKRYKLLKQRKIFLTRLSYFSYYLLVILS